MSYPYRQAAFYTQTSGRTIDLVVIHDAEYPERMNAARDVAAYFASGKVRASAHFTVDNAQIWQSVLEKDVAWHAPGANRNGIGIEHAGYAAQRAEDWADDYSDAELKLSASLVAGLCTKYKIPIAFRNAGELKAGGARGITTHAEVSAAWHQSDHTDPGPNFPMTWYLGLVKAARLPALNGPGGPDMATVVDARCAPGGGVWVFARDGGVFTYGGAPYKGSYPGLPAADRNDPSRVLDHVEIRPDGGYDLFMKGTAPDFEKYSFGP